MKVKSKMLYLFALGVFALGVIFMLAVMGFEDDVAEEAIVNQKCSEKLLITGLAEDKEISLAELKKLESVERVASWIDREGNKQSWEVRGILFDDFSRAFFDKSQQDFRSIRLSAGDGYSIEVPAEILKNREIILAYEINGQPLEPKHQPLRVIIPEERRMFWVFNLIEIEFIQEVPEYEISRIIILETAVDAVEQRDFLFDGKTYKAIRIKDIMNYFAKESTAVDVFIKATDGLGRNEREDTFIGQGYLKITGDCAPRFLAPELPRGMHVRKVLWFSYGETAFFAVDRGLEVFGPTGEKRGLSLEEIIRETGLRRGESYIFTAIDGSSIEIPVAYIDKGIIYLTDEDEYVAYFVATGKFLKGVVSIETITN
ncbi:molybdopterin-dependent oxidoreductase [Dehalococcoidia bacterium]|nr:molybdopterin-dependent oxidoreductase [Dehalococcoidia bacterium]